MNFETNLKTVVKHLNKNITKATKLVNDDIEANGLTTIHQLLLLDYDDGCELLKKKYGVVGGNYFATPSCKSTNNKIKRTKEGLLIHHIDEDKSIMLSTPSYAQENPWEYQLADRLVYCNLLEHMILHYKIVYKTSMDETFTAQGVGGVINFISPELNDIYAGIEYKSDYKKAIAKAVANDKRLYDLAVKYILTLDERFKPDDFNKSLSGMFNAMKKLETYLNDVVVKKLKGDL